MLPKVPVEEPPDLAKVMATPEVTGLLFKSFTVAVTVTDWPETTVPLEIEIEDCDAEGGAVKTVIGVELPNAEPLINTARFWAVPETTPVYVIV